MLDQDRVEVSQLNGKNALRRKVSHLISVAQFAIQSVVKFADQFAPQFAACPVCRLVDELRV